MQNNIVIRLKIVWVLITVGICLSACSSQPAPQHPNRICNVFYQYPSWYWAAQAANKKWSVKISTIMAIIYEESGFIAEAEPHRHYILGWIPWFRPTSAKGYPQAIDATWYLYCKHNHRLGANRSNFSDATDFIGWYINMAHHQLHIAKTDVYAMYLAYHQGIHGYRKQHYLYDQRLLTVAHHVAMRAKRYHYQLQRCEANLPKKPWWHVWI